MTKADENRLIRLKQVAENVAAIEDVLARGSVLIKKGHVVAGVSDGTADVFVPLSPSQEIRRREILASQREELDTYNALYLVEEIKGRIKS